MAKSYYGNYLGLVVQNNDPEKRGRVKIFVPHVSTVVYDNWTKPIDGKVQDKKFVFPDKETNPDLDKILPSLKDVLPWAECAAPLFGGSASGRYNAIQKRGTTSDSNYYEENEFKDGNRPIQNYIAENIYSDAFTDSEDTRLTNPYSYAYTPTNYSNLARGLFTIPNVGSHVWLFFKEGNPNDPVYFAVSHGKEDWQRIYSLSQESEEDFSSTDYPGTYENGNEANFLNDDAKTFRAKTVFNSNKNTIEFVDTDHREILKLTHFSGSFKEFTNYANIELATNNDQKMVIGDQYLTVRKNQSVYIAESQNVSVLGDRYLTVGKNTKETVEEIVRHLKEIHEYKLLFDIQRTEEGSAPNDVSIYQRQNGTYAICPVCQNATYTPSYDEMVIQGPFVFEFTPAMDGNPATALEFFEPLTYESLNLGGFADLVGQTGVWMGSICDVCKGEGYSPSSQDGEWAEEPHKQSGGTLNNLLKTKAPILAALERELDEGDEITTIAKNKVETIGLVMNDMKSFRTDPEGKIRIDGAHVALEGTYATFKPSPHVEYVDVDDVPGGDYNLTVTNKYKLLVGAKGVNIKTFGPIDIYGTIVNMNGEQVNISSQNEVLIDGGERFSIRARKVSLIPVEHNPVVVEGQLHVTRNTVIGGGVFMEGEVGLLHVTAPYEYHLTEMGSSIMTQGTVGGSPHTHGIPPHTHYYKHIPVTFMPAPEAVRDEMIARQINSTTSLAASKPIIGLSVGTDSDFNTYIFGPADDHAAALFTSRGFTSYSARPEGEYTVYTVYFNYNVNDVEGSENFRPNGLKVYVTFNPVEKTIIEITHEDAGY